MHNLLFRPSQMLCSRLGCRPRRRTRVQGASRDANPKPEPDARHRCFVRDSGLPDCYTAERASECVCMCVRERVRETSSGAAVGLVMGPSRPLLSDKPRTVTDALPETWKPPPAACPRSRCKSECKARAMQGYLRAMQGHLTSCTRPRRRGGTCTPGLVKH
jgi:hypothetical protein